MGGGVNRGDGQLSESEVTGERGPGGEVGGELEIRVRESGGRSCRGVVKRVC